MCVHREIPMIKGGGGGKIKKKDNSVLEFPDVLVACGHPQRDPVLGARRGAHQVWPLGLGLGFRVQGSGFRI